MLVGYLFSVKEIKSKNCLCDKEALSRANAGPCLLPLSPVFIEHGVHCIVPSVHCIEAAHPLVVRPFGEQFEETNALQST